MRKPNRGGKRHNLASIIKKRTDDASDSEPTLHHADVTFRKQPDASASLAAAVTAKIEDGNIRAAIRLLCSEDKPAPDTDATFSKLLDKYPAASVSSNLSPDPGTTSALQVSEKDVLK